MKSKINVSRVVEGDDPFYIEITISHGYGVISNSR